MLRSLHFPSRRVRSGLVLSVAGLFAGSCASPVPVASDDLRFDGRVTTVDMTPWAYDGNAIVTVDADGMGRVVVELPARWNLCRARPVERPDELAGQRVRVVARANGPGRAVVCEGPEHRLERLP